ncbi:MAG: hypothetical protein JNL88_02090 [Bacteroidia bacterium]|nr:hypothetical protein [Bacteroidia bacterium]
MNRLIAIPLLSIIFLQSGGLLLFYSLQQQFVKVYAAERLRDPEAGFEKIVLTKEAYEAARVNAHEVLLDGKMYDVKAVRLQGEQVELLAIHDQEEESILEEIRKLVGHNGSRNISYPQLLGKLMAVFYQVPAALQIGPGIHTLECPDTFMILEQLPYRPLDVPSPPPDFQTA